MTETENVTYYKYSETNLGLEYLTWDVAGRRICCCSFVGMPPSIELLKYPEYVKHSGYHFWYSSTRWAKIMSKPHLLVTFWSWRNDNLRVMYNYKPCTMSINSTTAKKIYFEKYFPVSMTLLQNKQFWCHLILRFFVFMCAKLSTRYRVE